MNFDENLIKQFIEENTIKPVSYSDIKQVTWDEEYNIDEDWDEEYNIDEDIDDEMIIDEELFICDDKPFKHITIHTKTYYRFNDNESYVYDNKGIKWVTIPFTSTPIKNKKRLWFANNVISTLVYLNPSVKKPFLIKYFMKFLNDVYEEPLFENEVIQCFNESDEKRVKIKKRKLIFNHSWHLNNDVIYKRLYEQIKNNHKDFIFYKCKLSSIYLGKCNSIYIRNVYDSLCKENPYKKWKYKDLAEFCNVCMSTIKKNIKLKTTKNLIDMCIENEILDTKEMAKLIGVTERTIKNNLK